MFLIGACLTGFALPMAISMIRALYLVLEHPYTYGLSNGLSVEDVAIRAVLFFALAVIGVVLMVFGWLKRKNKAMLDSIINAENQNYCSHCKINVAEENTSCPVCGKSLSKEGE